MAVLIKTIADNIARDVPGCPLFERERAVIKALQDFYNRAEFFKLGFQTDVKDSEVITWANNAICLKAPDNKKKPIRLKSLFFNGKPVSFAFRQIAETIDDFDSIFNTGIKFYNFSSDDRNQICLFPFRDADFNSDGDLRIFLELVLAPLDTVTKIENEIFVFWQDAIEAGAKAILMAETKKPWTNYQAAAAFNLKFQSEINRTIAQKRLIENGGEVRVQMRPFV